MTMTIGVDPHKASHTAVVIATRRGGGVQEGALDVTRLRISWHGRSRFRRRTWR